MSEVATLLDAIRRLHERLRRRILEACEQAAMEDLGAVAGDEEGDTIYAVDRIGEGALLELIEQELADHLPVVVIAEGLPGGALTLPQGAAEASARWRIIVDPIDGTRGLMYQKRSAWILTGAARNRGPATTLADIELAVQTEIPLLKQHLADMLWAARSAGARG
ncbi:MAG: inositol monophosphatase, partial [Bryobacteraceae bacterium]